MRKNLIKRIVVSLIGIPVLLFCAIYGSYFFLGLMLVILLLSIHEINFLGSKLDISRHNYSGFIFGLLASIDMYLYYGEHIFFLILGYLSLILIIAVFNTRQNNMLEVSFRCFSIFYLSLFLGTLILVREYPFTSGYDIGGKFILVVFLSVWLCDIMAYFGGKSMGKHLLFPRISPKKTVEGAVSGFLSSIGVFIVSHYTFFPELEIKYGIALGITIGVLGQLGDLIESYFKRQTGVKDSSTILPGHGGILDRFDSLIFVSPFVFYFLKFIIVDI